MDTIDISAVIVDDDPEAIQLLEMFLKQFPNITIVGKSTDPKGGLSIIQKLVPELIFLDIDMPDMTGLQVAESVKAKNIHSEIVFTTAYQDYAYKALKIAPLDFLTKPFCPEDLENVIKKYIARTEKEKHEQKLQKFIQSQSNPGKVKLPTFHSFIIIDVNEIVYIKANKSGTAVYLRDGTVETITRNLSSLLLMLNSSLIFQLNRGTYVNLNYLLRVDKKKEICIFRFNENLCQEYITKSNIVNFEKLKIFPAV